MMHDVSAAVTCFKNVKRESKEQCEAALKYLLGDLYAVSDNEEDGIGAENSKSIPEPQKREDPLVWQRANACHFPHSKSWQG